MQNVLKIISSAQLANVGSEEKINEILHDKGFRWLWLTFRLIFVFLINQF